MEDKIISICTATMHSIVNKFHNKSLPSYIQIGDIEKCRCFNLATGEDIDKKCEDCEYAALYEIRQKNGRTIIEEYVEDNK